MIYKLDNTPLSSFGAIPSRGNQFYALEGFMNLPRRIGTTEHNWGTSIEPFVDAEDIKMDCRNMNLCVSIKKNNLADFVNACIAGRLLSIDFADFSVVCKDEIKVEEIGEYCTAIVPFYQNAVELESIVIEPSGNGDYRLDNFNLVNDFGIHVSESNSLHNKAKRIDVNTTEFYIRTNFRGTRTININCSMRGSSINNLYYKMNQFHSLLISPGIHTLKLRNNEYNVYFKDGLTANIIAENIAQFTLRATVV